MSKLNELVEAFENLLGYVDSPVVRRKISDHQTQDVIAKARKALKEFKPLISKPITEDAGLSPCCKATVNWIQVHAGMYTTKIPLCSSCSKCLNDETGKEKD